MKTNIDDNGFTPFLIYTLEDLKPHPLYYFFIFFSK